MICPYCKKEMKQGYLQANSNILFSAQKHRLKMLPSDPSEKLIARQMMSPATVNAYFCIDCNKMIIDGNDVTD